MTRHQSFKRLVRTRMAKTGESYTAARATLLAAREPDAGPRPALATSDEMIRQRTGRGWEEWFDLLDGAGLAERPHRDIARWVAELQGADRQRRVGRESTAVGAGGRGPALPGQRPDGFAITASRTVGVPVGRLFGAFAGEAERGRWLADAELRERSATKPRSARFDWGDGRTRVNVTFQARGEARSTVTVEHTRLPDADAAARMKGWWRERLSALRELHEGRESDA